PDAVTFRHLPSDKPPPPPPEPTIVLQSAPQGGQVIIDGKLGKKGDEDGYFKNARDEIAQRNDAKKPEPPPEQPARSADLQVNLPKVYQEEREDDLKDHSAPLGDDRKQLAGGKHQIDLSTYGYGAKDRTIVVDKIEAKTETETKPSFGATR